MANKSVSLFEVLPPKGNKKPEKNNPVPESQSGAKASPSSEPRKAVEVPKSAERKSVDEAVFAPVPPKVQSHSAANRVTVSSESSTDGDISGGSSQKREDHFWLIALIMVGFSVVIGVACYRYGYKQGVGVGFRAAVAQKDSPSKNEPQFTTPAKEEFSQAPTNKTPILKREILPTRLTLPTPEQKKAVAPAVPPKRYTLQVQTMGRNQKSSADALVLALRKGGFDAFADYREGAVFVGRLEKSRDEQATALKKRVSRFNYHNLNFSRAYFRPIPKHLLEN